MCDNHGDDEVRKEHEPACSTEAEMNSHEASIDDYVAVVASNKHAIHTDLAQAAYWKNPQG